MSTLSGSAGRTGIGRGPLLLRRPRLGLPRSGLAQLSALLLGAMLLLGACSSGQASKPSPSGLDPTACAGRAAAQSYPGWPSSSASVDPYLIYSSQLAVGPNRFLYTLIDASNNLLAAPGVTTDLAFFDLNTDPSKPAFSTTGTYLDSGTGRGLYRTSADFTCSGAWGVEVTTHRPGQADSTARVAFPVLAASSTPAIGAKAPAVDTPTATDATGIAAISTDTTPDPDFYRYSIAQAVSSGKPSLIVFATPAFCRTRVCGPTLDVVKSVAAGYKDKVDFVHVEPYILQQTAQGLQPVLDAKGSLQNVPAVTAYGLQAEPYIVVTDAQGRVTAKFEGIAGADELTAALDAVTKG